MQNPPDKKLVDISHNLHIFSQLYYRHTHNLISFFDIFDQHILNLRHFSTNHKFSSLPWSVFHELAKQKGIAHKIIWYSSFPLFYSLTLVKNWIFHSVAWYRKIVFSKEFRISSGNWNHLSSKFSAYLPNTHKNLQRILSQNFIRFIRCHNCENLPHFFFPIDLFSLHKPSDVFLTP